MSEPMYSLRAKAGILNALLPFRIYEATDNQQRQIGYRLPLSPPSYFVNGIRTQAPSPIARLRTFKDLKTVHMRRTVSVGLST